MLGHDSSLQISGYAPARSQAVWHIPSSPLRRALQVASAQLGADVSFSRTPTSIGTRVGSEALVKMQDGVVLGQLRCPNSAAPADVVMPVLELLAGLLAEIARPDVARVVPNTELEGLQARILRATSGQGIYSVLQPIVEITTGEVVGAEALVRFDELPEQPDIWFADAFAVGMELELDIAAARKALRLMPEIPPDCFLAVNISPTAMTSPLLSELLEGVDLHRLVLEVTEHSPVADYQRIADALEPYRAAGVRLAVDDAGAGYASFRHILLLRPDLIKVDISLVRDIHLDPVRQALVAAMTSLARKTGADLIAEGVELQAELDMLARLGVHHGQGFLFAKPADQLAACEYPRPTTQMRLPLEVDDVSVDIAIAVDQGTDLETLTRPLLDVVLRLTGLESSYLGIVDHAKCNFSIEYARNAGSMTVHEGMQMSWLDSLCFRAQAAGLTWSADVPLELPGSAMSKLGPKTFMAVPIHARDGNLIAAVCGLSTQACYVSEIALAQVRLCAHLIATLLLPR